MIVSDEQFGASYQIMNVIFVVVAVIGKYPHLLHLENWMSATYAQLAQYYRSNTRKRCIV